MSAEGGEECVLHSRYLMRLMRESLAHHNAIPAIRGSGIHVWCGVYRTDILVGRLTPSERLGFGYKALL